jgi:hypothetical protein
MEQAAVQIMHHPLLTGGYPRYITNSHQELPKYSPDWKHPPLWEGTRGGFYLDFLIRFGTGFAATFRLGVICGTWFNQTNGGVDGRFQLVKHCKRRIQSPFNIIDRLYECEPDSNDLRLSTLHQAFAGLHAAHCQCYYP